MLLIRVMHTLLIDKTICLFMILWYLIILLLDVSCCMMWWRKMWCITTIVCSILSSIVYSNRLLWCILFLLSLQLCTLCAHVSYVAFIVSIFYVVRKWYILLIIRLCNFCQCLYACIIKILILVNSMYENSVIW